MLAGQSESLSDFDDLVPLVALSTGEVDELPGHRDDGAPLRRRTGHRDTAPTAKSQETFVSERAQCSQDGVVVHAEDGSKISCGSEPLAWQGLTVRNGSPNCGGDLHMERGLICRVDHTASC